MLILRSMLTAVAVAAMAPAAWAGAKLTMEVRELDQASKQAVRSTILIDGNDVAMNVDKQATIIFDGKERKLTIVNHSEKRYMTLGERQLEELRKQLEASMKQMRQMMANLPPEQRKQLEQQMGQMDLDGAAKKPKVELKKLSEKKTLQGKTCQMYELRHDGKLTGKMCVADYAALGPTAEAAKALQNLTRFSEKISRGMPMLNDPASAQLAHALELNGLPLLWQDLQDGKAVREMRVVELQVQKVPASTFSPPKGYKPQELPQMGGPGGAGAPSMR